MKRGLGSKLLLLVFCLLFLTVATSAIAVAQSGDPWDWEEEAEDAAGWWLFGSAMCLVGVVVMWIIFILIAIWVYKDAESRGQNGVLWLIIVILLGLIGLIIYLVVRPKEQVGQYPPQQPPQYPPQ